VEPIVRYGQHIDLAAIAETASGHPEVITSAAVGRSDGYRTEVPALYVVLRRKDPEIIADLEAHIRRKLPGVPGACSNGSFPCLPFRSRLEAPLTIWRCGVMPPQGGKGSAVSVAVRSGIELP
jgi:acyl-CoA synthetase (AMP-forming)/AMP-acid ligase II